MPFTTLADPVILNLKRDFLILKFSPKRAKTKKVAQYLKIQIKK